MLNYSSDFGQCGGDVPTSWLPYESVRNFTCSPRVSVGFLWVLQFPPKNIPVDGLTDK